MSEQSFWSPGQIIDNRFKVVGCLGEGGMGVVLQAWHEELRRPIAIKLLRQGGSIASQTAERFLREARSAARLQSEHAVRIFDAKTLPDGTPYIVMEHLEGLDLAELLRRQGPLPIGVAVDHTVQALVAIAEAHASGLVHRDLKPSNLFLTRRSDGTPLIKVLDFGLAKAVVNDDGDPVVTSTNDVVGSPGYMSPEQLCDSKSVDQQSDVWSLGVLLYQLLSGHLPFEQPSRSELTVAILTRAPVPLRTVLPTVPKALDKVVMSCLEKDKGQRHVDVAALALGLLPFASPSCHALVDQVVRTMKAAPVWKPHAGVGGRSRDGDDACAATVIQNKVPKPAPRSKPQRGLLVFATIIVLAGVLAATQSKWRRSLEPARGSAISTSAEEERPTAYIEVAPARPAASNLQPTVMVRPAKAKASVAKDGAPSRAALPVSEPADDPPARPNSVEPTQPAAVASPIESRF